MALKLQDQALLMTNICDLLDRIAKIYQIPNYDYEVNSILLAEWILDEYKHYDLNLVQETLRNPPKLNDQAWRLTPDTIRDWIDLKRNKEADLKIKQESEKRQSNDFENTDDLSPETRKMVQDYLNSLIGIKEVNPLTDEDVKKYGKERLKKEAKSLGYVPPNKEYLIEKELRRRWSNEVHDKYTGKPLENWLSFEEWKLI